jgi:GNAT superfamily N-acetyltransferase
MIREICSNDIETCARLLIEAYNNEPWNNHWTTETANKYLNEFFSNKDFVGFVICEDDTIIGAMFAHRKTWWTNDELFVDEFYITPHLQRQGYGKSLLVHAEQYAKSQNLAGLTLLTNRYFPAKIFYEKHKYTQADHVVFMYKEL